MQRQWQQARLFIDEGLSNSAIAIVRPGTLMRHLVAPLERLAIALLQRGEGAGCPERIAHIANRPLHTSFLIPGPHLAGTRHEVIMRCQLQQPRLKWIWLPCRSSTADFKLS